MSAFFHARQSSELLPEHAKKFNPKPSAIKKRGVLHERSPSDINSERPTIRLVQSNASPEDVYNKTPFPHMPSQVLQPPPKSSKRSGDALNEENGSGPNPRPRDYLHPKNNTSTTRSQHLTSRQSHRLSTFSQASTTASATDTLMNDSLFSPNSCRFSTDATLRNTPTPMESEEREAERLEEEFLTPVEEISFETSTIRPVTASTSPESSGSRGSDQSAKVVPIPRPVGNEYVAESDPAGPASSVNPPSPFSSSPPNHSRSSSWNIIRYASSNESMASVQYPQVRPPTAKSQSASSWTAGEEDSLPPLSVPRKRQHMHSASVGVNPLSNLSTIHSESETSSRTHTQTNSRNLSEKSSFDVFTSPPQIPTSSSRSGNWYIRRRTIASSSYSSLASEYHSVTPQNSGWELNRASSAIPEPLFSSSPRAPPTSSPMTEQPSSYSMYELPGDAPSEQDDTIAELQPHPLRTKRSGYLPRGRSQSEPHPESARSNHTTVPVDRTSQGSSIFPQWAKTFYRGKSMLPNAYGSTHSLPRSDSQVTSPSQSMRMMPWAYHRRWESAGNSLFSNQETAGTPITASPRSSHFLPSIFRPYTQGRMQQNTSHSTNTMSHARSSSTMEMYVDDSQLSDSESSQGSEGSRDSMAITPVLPSAHLPRRQQTVTSGRAIPRDRTYSSSNYPCSLSASHMYATPPHLAPSRRLSHRLSTWRAPSFDEALNTLVLSRGNRQILLFCCGFLCPILWMIAAVLPLPLRSADAALNNLESSVQNLSELEGDKSRFALGAQLEMLDWEQEKRYLKARWWRNLNRIMSIVGVGILAAIIALAVVASK